MKFQATIEINNINPYVLVHAARAQRLQPAWRKRLPVLVQVNGRPDPPWRINMMPVGDGSFYLYLHGEIRKASATKVGDKVEICLSFDEDYRNGPVHEMPGEFARRLDENPAAQQQWHKLPPSRKKEMLRYLARLKSEEAQSRNIDAAMRVLSGSQERFMARDWNMSSSG
jgi:Bacteriocin-protection, YdeI or OmpD-Associated/Domain of unknown function (DUF1905)